MLHPAVYKLFLNKTLTRCMVKGVRTYLLKIELIVGGVASSKLLREKLFGDVSEKLEQCCQAVFRPWILLVS